MTRRTLLQSTLLGAGGASCARKGRLETLAAVSDMAQREDLVIVGSRLASIVNAPEAFTVTGADAGPLAVVDQPYNRSVSGLDLVEVKRLRISSNGELLCAASRESFVVLDVPARRAVLERDGRFPSLSPNGSSLAFLDRRGDLVITTLATGASRVITSPWWTVVGVGGWSPHGRFLLAGARPAFSVFIHLVAIDCATDEFAEIRELDEGDRGETSVWLKRRLLSNVRPGVVA